MPLPHHLRIDVLTADEADGERTPIFVEAARLAADAAVLDHAGERRCRHGAAWPGADPLALAGLACLRRVDALQPDADIADVEGVAVDDPGGAPNGASGRLRSGGALERDGKEQTHG